MTNDNCQEQFWKDEKRTERRSPDHPVVRAFVLPKIKFITRNIELNKNSTLLDVGCGNGFFTCRLAELADVTGLDFSEQMLRINPHHKLIRGNAENLPFGDNSFDVVFCSNMLHHLERPEKAIAEMKRVAKKYVIISEPNRNNPLMFLSSLMKKEERGALKFTKKHIDGICQKLGLKSVKFLISGLIYPNKVPDVKALLFLLKIFDYNQWWGSYITIIYQKQ